MALAMRAEMGVRAEQHLTVVTQLSSLLALGLDELRARVQQELADNPALTLANADADRGSRGRQAGPGPGEDAFARDPLQHIPVRETRSESLIVQLALQLPRTDRAIAEAVVGSLDERGYLRESPGQLAADLRVSEARVQRVLDELKRVAPGLGARNARECLLDQLDQLAREGRGIRLAREILEHHLADAAHRRWRQIAVALHTTEKEVVLACERVRNELKPFPELPPDQGPEPRLRPDAVIKLAEDDSRAFSIELLGETGIGLRIDPLYLEVARGDGSADAHAWRHAFTLVHQGRRFIWLLRQRADTVRRTIGAAVEHQHEFVRNGTGLRPLTRVEIARELGLHESTVSRVVADKNLRLPDGRVIPLARLFGTSLPVENALRELLAGEGAERSDRELSVCMTNRGYPLGRRAVAKYRARLGVGGRASRARANPSSPAARPVN